MIQNGDVFMADKLTCKQIAKLEDDLLELYFCDLFQSRDIMYWLRSFSNLDRSRFVRRNWSSPVKKNTQIFLDVVGVVILFSSVQSAADHALFYK